MMTWTLTESKPHVPAALSPEAIEELRLIGLYPIAADLLATVDALTAAMIRANCSYCDWNQEALTDLAAAKAAARAHIETCKHHPLAHYKRLEAILESREDVRDGPDGEQLPNEAMSILTEWRGPV